MIDKGYEALARRIVGLEQRLEAFSRTRQLGTSSVTLADGSDASVSGGVGAGNDAQHAIAGIGDSLTDVDEINDAEVEHSVSVPEWIENSGTDVAWDSSQYAAALAAQLETELGEAKENLDQALADATTALSEAGLARSEAAEAVSDAADAVAKATQAIQDALAASVKADGVNTFSDRVPVAADADGKPVGAAWFVRDSAGISQVWELTSLGWVERPLEEAIIPKVAIGEGTYGDLSGGRIVAGSIVTEKLDALAVTAAKLAAEAVTAVKIAADAVTTEKIAAGAVTANEIAALAITAEKLAAASITAEKIAAGAITTGKLAADAIDGMTITGALIRTAPWGSRLELDDEGLKAFDASNNETVRVQSESGVLSINKLGSNLETQLSNRGIYLTSVTESDGIIHYRPLVTIDEQSLDISGDWVGATVDPATTLARLRSHELNLSVSRKDGTPATRAYGDLTMRVRPPYSEYGPNKGAAFIEAENVTQLGIMAPLIYLNGRTVFPGNTFYLRADLNNWIDAPDGTRAWVTDENREYVRVQGAWKPLETHAGDGEWVIPRASGIAGTITATKTGATVEVVFEVTATITTGGHVTLGTLPPALRPPSGRRTGVVWVGGARYGAIAALSSGTLAVANLGSINGDQVTGSLSYRL